MRDDPPVVDFDPGLELVCLPKAVLGQQTIQVAGPQPARRRLVVVRDPVLEGQPRHPSTASDGIHEIAVTDDSMRIMRSLRVDATTLDQLNARA